MNTATPIGTFMDHGARYQMRVDLRIEPAQLRDTGRTINHEPIAADAVEVAIQGETWHAKADGSRDRRHTDMAGGGQNINDLRRVPGARAARIAELWDRWHLNGMRAGCAHQGETWTCTRDANAEARETARRIGADPGAIAPDVCGTLNGWPVIRELFGEHPYPKRGDACHVCDRARWDEPSDACPETGYRYGTAWLYEPVPPEIIAELRRLFGHALPAEPVPA